MKTWRESIIDNIVDLTKTKGSLIFSRQELINKKLHQIIEEVGPHGETPAQTLSRVLQELRDDNLIDFIDNSGNYLSLIQKVHIENEDLPETAIDVAIRSNKLTFNDIHTDEKVGFSRQRIGQSRLRFWTLNNYEYQCALCDISEPKYLITSHLARWSDYPEGRGDLQNIVCVCKWHDPLIEYGLISFTDDYQILKKHQNSRFLDMIMESTDHYREPISMPLAHEYLRIHRIRSGFN